MGNRNLVIGAVVVVLLVIGAFFLFGRNGGQNGAAPAATAVATDTPVAAAMDAGIPVIVLDRAVLAEVVLG